MISLSTSDVVGINFGDSHITAARLKGKGEGPYSLTHAACVPYDPAASEKEIASVIKSLWKTAKFPTSSICASLRSAALVVRYFKFPAMSAGELKGALELQAEESMQVSRGSLVVDWHLNRDGTEGGGLVEGVLVAAPSKDVDRWLNILFAAGLDPMVLDVRAMAVANLYAALGGRKTDAVTCLVNLSPHSADVIVLSKTGALYPHTVFCRATAWGETPAFLSENIRDVTKYSEFKLDWEPVQRVVLTGELPADAGFVAKVQEGVRLPVERWDPLTALTVKSKGLQNVLDSGSDHGAMLVPSLGLALRRG